MTLSNEELVDTYGKIASGNLDYAMNTRAELLARLDRITSLEAEVDRLRCCGNCKLYDGDAIACGIDMITFHNRHCEHWTTDGLSRKEREG